MLTRARIIIILYLVAIAIGGISATKYYQLISEYNKQEPWYDKNLEINPNDTTALTNKAIALYQQGDYNDSLQYLNKALKINPNDVGAINAKSLVESKLRLVH